MTAVLTVHDVSYTYPSGETPALLGVDLDVAPGECVALLGPNGAGKTTLIAAVTGLRVPDHGEVRVADGDPTRAATRTALGVMLQDTVFPRHLTVQELVRGAAVRAGSSVAAVPDVIAEVGLTGFERRRSGRLSGGQRQRLQLARALVTDPELLVLDEPTESLDTDARREFWARLSDRRDAGMAVLVTTHLIEEAGAVADRVVVIADGKIVADADPRSLAGRLPECTITARTVIPADRLRSLDGVIDATCGQGAGDGPPLLRLVSREPEQIVRFLLDHDPDLTSLRVEGASLEDAVMAASGRRRERTGPPMNARTTDQPEGVPA